MENLINKIKANLVSKIQSIRITRFTNSLIVNGKGMIKSITIHGRFPSYGRAEGIVIIIDDGTSLTITTTEVFTTSYQDFYHFTLNEVISFDKRFEIKTTGDNISGFATYTIE